MKIFILSPAVGYRNIYSNKGWQIVNSPEKADLLQFTGGEDVNPLLYHQDVHITTNSNHKRDEKEKRIFDEFVGKTPMTGICRGGQFLNVMSGGSMYQDVNNHLGDHIATMAHEDRRILVSSTHHQMMNPSEEGNIFLTSVRSTHREYMDDRGKLYKDNGYQLDTEAVFYPKTRCLCFQPHAEFLDDRYRDMTEYYFSLIDKCLFS